MLYRLIRSALLNPKPVFDWSIKISFDNSAESMTLTIDIQYDHMDNNPALEDIAGVFAGLFTAGFTGDPFAGIGAGIAVGQSLNAAYDAAANRQVSRCSGGPSLQRHLGRSAYYF